MLIVPEIFCLVRKGVPIVFSELQRPFGFQGMNLPYIFYTQGAIIKHFIYSSDVLVAEENLHLFKIHF